MNLETKLGISRLILMNKTKLVQFFGANPSKDDITIMIRRNWTDMYQTKNNDLEHWTTYIMALLLGGPKITEIDILLVMKEYLWLYVFEIHQRNHNKKPSAGRHFISEIINMNDIINTTISCLPTPLPEAAHKLMLVHLSNVAIDTWPYHLASNLILQDPSIQQIIYYLSKVDKMPRLSIHLLPKYVVVLDAMLTQDKSNAMKIMHALMLSTNERKYPDLVTKCLTNITSKDVMFSSWCNVKFFTNDIGICKRWQNTVLKLMCLGLDLSKLFKITQIEENLKHAYVNELGEKIYTTLLVVYSAT